MPLLLSFNLWLFTFVHSFSGQSTGLDYIMIFFADYAQYVVVAAFVFLLIRTNNRWQNCVMVFVATGAAVGARYCIKTLILLYIAEPRPYVYLHFTPLIQAAAGEEWQSFPSGHALFFFALAMTTYKFNKKYGRYLFIIAILMGIARIYTGVHWPLDIIAGAGLGILFGCATYYGYKALKKYMRDSQV